MPRATIVLPIRIAQCFRARARPALQAMATRRSTIVLLEHLARGGGCLIGGYAAGVAEAGPAAATAASKEIAAATRMRVALTEHQASAVNMVSAWRRCQPRSASRDMSTASLDEPKIT